MWVVSLCVNGKLLPRLRELSLGPLPIEMWSLGSSALGIARFWPEAEICGVCAERATATLMIRPILAGISLQPPSKWLLLLISRTLPTTIPIDCHYQRRLLAL